MQEKIERAENYARVMRELSQLGQFVRLADYLFVEAVMATAVANVEELLGVLTAHKQQVRTAAGGRGVEQPLQPFVLGPSAALLQQPPGSQLEQDVANSMRCMCCHACSSTAAGGQDQGPVSGGGRL